MLESSSRGGPSPTQFGNLKLEDVPQHVLATILDPLQAPRVQPQPIMGQSAARVSQNSPHSEIEQPHSGSQQAEHCARIEQGGSGQHMGGHTVSQKYASAKSISDDGDGSLDARKKAAQKQMHGLPSETASARQKPGCSAVTGDRCLSQAEQPVDVDKVLTKESCASVGSSCKAETNEGVSKGQEGNCQVDMARRLAGVNGPPSQGHTQNSAALHPPDPAIPSQGSPQRCEASVGKPNLEKSPGAWPRSSDVPKPKPKVVTALPSSSSSQQNKKVSWVHVAAKKPIHVPYATHAAGTVMAPQSRQNNSTPPSQLHGVSASSKPAASGASAPFYSAGTSPSYQHSSSERANKRNERKSYSVAGCTTHEHRGPTGVGLQKQNSPSPVKSESPTSLMSSYVLGREPSSSHHQTCSDSNLELHRHYVQSSSPTDGMCTAPSSVQGLDYSLKSGSCSKKEIESWSRQNNHTSDFGKGYGKSIGRMPQDATSRRQFPENDAERMKGSKSSREASMHRPSSRMDAESVQVAQEGPVLDSAIHSSSRAVPASQWGPSRGSPSMASAGSESFSPTTETAGATVNPPSSSENIFVKPVKSDKVMKLLDFLCSTEAMQPCRFWEQGITNLGNTCFLGSALQMLLGSGHFCAMLVRLGALQEYLSPVWLPTLFALGELANKLLKRPQPNGKQSTTVLAGSHGRAGRISQAIVPTMLAPILDSFHKRFSSHMGGPEEHDAQEFLLFLLEKIESELMLIKGHVRGHEEDESQPESDSDGWMIAGKKNKGMFRRTAGSKSSNILISLFCGTIESHVIVKDHLVKNKAPSVTAHRFTALDLDIANEKVNTIDDALKLYTAKDIISDYKVEKCSRPVTAEKTNYLGNMPPVLLVSLKRYMFTERGMEKIQKRISFQSTLKIPGKLRVAREHTAHYELVATCSHHGHGHGGDHYTSNVKQPDGSWVHFDDSMVYNIKEKDVIGDAPYLMLYMKSSQDRAP